MAKPGERQRGGPLAPRLILVPSLRTITSYSCRCQAKRMYLSPGDERRSFSSLLFPRRDVEHWCRQTCSLSSGFGVVSQEHRSESGSAAGRLFSTKPCHSQGRRATLLSLSHAKSTVVLQVRAGKTLRADEFMVISGARTRSQSSRLHLN